MKRLTMRNSDGTVSQPYGVTVEEVFYRLAEYEDRGMEPDEIKDNMEMFHAYHYVCAGHKPEHIRELLQSEQDGRLVVLPFKIGTTLYRVTTPYRQEPKITEFIVTNFVMRGKKHELMVEVRVNGVPGTNVMKIKSFYRTREEAEEALAEK